MSPKDYLKRYEIIELRIREKQEQVSVLRERARSVCSPSLSGGAHSTDKSDRVARLTERLVDMERDINAEIDRLADTREEIMAVIEQLPDERLKLLLEMKYISLKTLEQIAVAMDYSYKQICRLHGKALAAVKDVLECPTGNVL